MKCDKCGNEIDCDCMGCHYFTQQLHPVSLGAYESEELTKDKQIEL
ncbi:hypothetical protein DS98202_22 [Lactococcus phage 98202]|nr:hypothetical protein DS98202_22 [Lactococcus phage 98202]